MSNVKHTNTLPENAQILSAKGNGIRGTIKKIIKWTMHSKWTKENMHDVSS
jgi:hypothetical protein